MRFATNTVLPVLLVVSFVLEQASLLNAQEETQWERIHLRTTFNLWGVSFADSLTGLAVGDYGVILRTVDGGETWEQSLSEEQFALRRIRFFNDTVAIAAGFMGSLIRSTDAGQSWNIIRLESDVNFSSMALTGQTGWVGGSDGVLYKTTDNGATWNKKSTGTTNVITSLSFADRQHGFCSAQDRILRSSDGGESWIKMEAPSPFPVTAIHAISVDTILLADYNRSLFRSTDGGESWTRLNAYRCLYRSIAVDNNGTGWAVGKGGVIVREKAFSSYDSTGTQTELNGEGAATGSEQLAADRTRWTQVFRSQVPWINAICFLDNGKSIAVGYNGTVLRCTVCNTGKKTTPPME